MTLYDCTYNDVGYQLPYSQQIQCSSVVILIILVRTVEELYL